ncbi:hypothetical protein [Streptomyces longwoodensis]|uniref:hypothetical protein n=1 Tax=Streptomyces longwoodensis TaxID=68231 RepID=UPI001470CB54|nr:hypothetical protein [Streptomyces longwoodensis]
MLVNNVGAMFAERQMRGGVEASFVVNHMTDPKIVSPALRLLWPLVRRTFA